jgi:hypothetical protein
MILPFFVNMLVSPPLCVVINELPDFMKIVYNEHHVE